MDSQQTPTTADLNSLATALSTLATAQTMVATEMAAMAKGMEDVVERLEKAVEGMGKLGKGAEGLVDHVDSVRDIMKDLLKSTSNLGVLLKKDTATVADVKKAYEGMLKILNKTLNASTKNTQQYYATKSAISDVENILKSITAEHNKGNSKLKDQSKLVESIKKNMEKIEVSGGKISGVFNHLGLNKAHKAILDINSALGRSGRMERAVRQGQRFHDTKEEIRNRKRAEGVHHRPRDLKEGFIPTLNKNGKLRKRSFFDKRGLKENDLLDENGEFDINKVKGEKGEKARKALLDFHFNPENGSTQPQGIAGRLNRHLANKAMKRGDMAGFSEAMEGGGLLEGGLGLMAELAGPVGGALMVGGAIKDGFDTVAKQNQEVEKSLGKGGIFSGKHGGIKGLNNAKENLKAYGFNRMGVTTERNIAVAQAMQESGSNLSGLTNEGIGMRTSGVGDIADIAMKQAREMGLTDVEGTKQTLKMLQTYKMTLDGTQTFFRTVGKDITTAGLSTGKYLELIDDITGQFDSMGKSIESVTTILRAMGSTGTETYEQLKENFTTLLGKPQTHEQQAFGMMSMSDKEFKEYGKDLQDKSDMQIQKLHDVLQEAVAHLPSPEGVDIFKGLKNKFNTPQGMEEAISKFKDINIKQGGVSNDFTKKIEPAKMDALNAMMESAGAKDRLNAAFSGSVTDETALSKITKTINALVNTAAASGISPKSLMTDPTVVGRNAAIFSQTGEQLGLEPNKVLKIRQGVSDISDSIINELKYGTDGKGLDASVTKGENRDAIYAKYLEKAAPGTSYEPGHAEEKFKSMSTYTLESGFREAMIKRGALGTEVNPNTVVMRSMAAHHETSVEDQLKNIADLVVATRDSSSYLKGIEDAVTTKAGHLFNIFTVLNKHWPADSELNTAQKVKALSADETVKSDGDILAQIARVNPKWKDPAATGAAIGLTVTEIIDKLAPLTKGYNEGTLSSEQRKEYLNLTAAKQEMSNDFKLQMTPNAKDPTDDPLAFSNRVEAEKEAEKASGIHYDQLKGTVIHDNPVAGKGAEKVAPASTDSKSSDSKPGGISYNTINNYGGQQHTPMPFTGTARPSQEQAATSYPTPPAGTAATVPSTMPQFA